MKKSSYILLKKKIYQKYSDITFDTSYDMKKKEDKESIGTIKFYDDKMINAVIKRSMTNQFKKLLDFILKMEEDDDPEGLFLCLNEIEKFKKEMNNRYEKYLNKKQKELLKKKTDIIESDIKNKLIAYRISRISLYPKNDYEEEFEEERHRTR